MGVVYSLDAIRFIIYTNDHDPPHIHIKNTANDFELKVEIKSREFEIKKNEKRFLKANLISKILKVVEENEQLFTDKWNEYHES